MVRLSKLTSKSSFLFHLKQFATIQIVVWRKKGFPSLLPILLSLLFSAVIFHNNISEFEQITIFFFLHPNSSSSGKKLEAPCEL